MTRVCVFGGAVSISPLMTKYLRGYDVAIMTRNDTDPNGADKYYGLRGVKGGAKVFCGRALLRAMRCDIMHIHGTPKFLPYVRRVLRNRIKVILHCHGPNERLIPPETRAEHEGMADKILVSTEDLLQYEFASRPAWLPNPVDTDLFAPRPDIRKDGTGLVIMKHGQTRLETTDRMKQLGIWDTCKWTLMDRRHVPLVQYRDMPALLGQYEYYANIAYIPHTGIHMGGMSLTSLQSLAMGLKVFGSDGTRFGGLPDRHRPRNVAALLDKIYQSLL